MAESPSERRKLMIAGAVLLLAVVAIAIYTWVTLSGSEVTANGGLALALGILGTVALGAGLMALVFFSHRHGYDEKVGGRSRPTDRD